MSLPVGLAIKPFEQSDAPRVRELFAYTLCSFRRPSRDANQKESSSAPGRGPLLLDLAPHFKYH
jgi:hypothetical protein